MVDDTALMRLALTAYQASTDPKQWSVLVLRANGTVEHAKPPALALLATAGVIRMLGNRIQRIGQLDMATLEHALRFTALGMAQSLSTWYEDEAQLRTALLRMTPLPREHAVRQRWPAAEVLLMVETVDATLDRTTLLHAAAHRYQLTRAETALLEQLLAGATLTEAAAHQKVRISTMRTHMSHLLAKAGSRRQSDLLRRFSS